MGCVKSSNIIDSFAIVNNKESSLKKQLNPEEFNFSMKVQGAKSSLSGSDENCNNQSSDNNNTENPLNPIPIILSNKTEPPISSSDILKIINDVRLNPKNYIAKISNLKNKIIVSNNRTFLEIEDSLGKLNYFLFPMGSFAIDNCVSYLINNAKKMNLKELILKDNLSIPFPINNSKLCIELDYIKSSLELKKLECKNKYKIIDFHYDVCINNPELSVLLQIIDATNHTYHRRKNIFNNKAKYIGISNGLMYESLYCYYFVFADEK